MEKLLVTQALDERDLLKKKINDAIRKAKYVVVCKQKDKEINGIKVEDIEKTIQADWQSINDMIERYNRINSAIILSNATTTIKFKNGKEMTKAEAIALKNAKADTAFIDSLINYADSSYKVAVSLAAKIESSQADTRTNYINNTLTGNDKKNIDEDTLETIDKFVAPFGPKWINPIDIESKVKKLKEENDEFFAEVETLIKVSNATTEIEF